jgi:uncharacterized protein YcbK (DUF882 family)
MCDCENRRVFLKGCLGLGAALAAPSVLARAISPLERSLALRNLHTGEKAEVIYWADGDYVHDELHTVSQVLRDHRSGEIHPIDARLLDQLYLLQHKLGTKRAFHVISGYRSPASNAKLQANSSGVAKRSLHMEGRAIDIRLPGVQLGQLRQAALDLKAGGVGYYPKSDFIHVDTGRVRFW